MIRTLRARVRVTHGHDQTHHDETHRYEAHRSETCRYETDGEHRGAADGEEGDQGRSGPRRRAGEATVRTSTTGRPANRAATDAIALLKRDHRDVEQLFKRFEKAGANARGQAAARRLDDRGVVRARRDRGVGVLPGGS